VSCIVNVAIMFSPIRRHAKVNFCGSCSPELLTYYQIMHDCGANIGLNNKWLIPNSIYFSMSLNWWHCEASLDCWNCVAKCTLKLHLIQDLYYYRYNTIVRNVMAYNIYHIYTTNIKDNGVIEPVHIRLKSLYLSQIPPMTLASLSGCCSYLL
jgi:hypothetical protein